ncbi:MAG TPA: palindromic element RPE4 domain-containing protein [Rickettsia endosymbiont of Ceroptres masudai]|nr:palindromic element RPE4 domain-containing protein [Rickettsia endosymbiont of Ceroptres masudai]
MVSFFLDPVVKPRGDT